MPALHIDYFLGFGDFSESDYLAFLSKFAPLNLSEQLAKDAHPDLMLDDYVQISDLIQPLSLHIFPAICKPRSIPISRLAGILEYIIIGYHIDLNKEDKNDCSYKIIYIASFYLHCCLNGAIEFDFFGEALLVLSKATEKIDFEGRIQVSRFIASLARLIQDTSISDLATISTILMGLFSIFITIANGIGNSLVDCMGKDQYSQDLKKGEGWPYRVELLRNTWRINLISESRKYSENIKLLKFLLTK